MRWIVSLQSPRNFTNLSEQRKDFVEFGRASGVDPSLLGWSVLEVCERGGESSFHNGERVAQQVSAKKSEQILHKLHLIHPLNDLNISAMVRVRTVVARLDSVTGKSTCLETSSFSNSHDSHVDEEVSPSTQAHSQRSCPYNRIQL